MRHLLLVTLLLAGCRDDAPASQVVPAHDRDALLIDRNWLDTWPERASDHMHVVRFVPSMGGGVFQDRTVFQGEFELFTFDVHGDVLDLRLPHTAEHVVTHYKIEKVKGPEPFTLKLTLDKNPRGPKVYYSNGDLTGTTAAELDAQLR